MKLQARLKDGARAWTPAVSLQSMPGNLALERVVDQRVTFRASDTSASPPRPAPPGSAPGPGPRAPRGLLYVHIIQQCKNGFSVQANDEQTCVTWSVNSSVILQLAFADEICPLPSHRRAAFSTPKSTSRKFKDRRLFTLLLVAVPSPAPPLHVITRQGEEAPATL